MRYKLFGRDTGLRVSEFALGTGMFGTRWGYGATPDVSARMLDQFLDAGGTFVDTADSYQFGESEEIVGAQLGERRVRVVLATKYSMGAAPDASLAQLGNSRRTMIAAVEDSLRRLRTDRIDLLWVHLADGATSSEEIVRGLDDLTRAGKIVYAGLSNFPAWRVARAVTLAEWRGATPIVGIQVEYSLVERGGDREFLPMAAAMGLGVAGWSPLGGGLLSGKYRRGETGRAEGMGRLVKAEDDDRTAATLDAVIAIAEARGRSPAQIAIAWAGTRGIVPVLGPRTTEQLTDNLGAVGLTLSLDEIDRLDQASRIALGIPHEMLAQDAQRERLAGGDPAAIDMAMMPVA